jgi:hypothetical protein
VASNNLSTIDVTTLVVSELMPRVSLIRPSTTTTSTSSPAWRCLSTSRMTSFFPASPELRRVCRGQLVMSVPFQEREPVPRGHLRRFEPWDIADLFPDAQLTLPHRPRMPWMLIEERPDGSPFTPRASGERVSLSTLTPDQQRIRQLEEEVEKVSLSTVAADQKRIRQLEDEIKRLRSRRALRLADAAGGLLRSARRRVRAVGSGR